MNQVHSRSAQLLINAARTLGARVQEAEAVLAGKVLNAEVWVDLPADAVERPQHDLPHVVSAARLDDTPVLFGELGEQADPSVVADALRRYRNQATIARSWLGADAQDLQLFLTGPADGARDSWWREIARHIEADDRVCRKLVWLPKGRLSLDAAVEFLGRTFLAAPWRQTQPDDSKRLDQMSTLPLPTEWLAVLSDESLSPDLLVERLVEATE